MSRPKKNIEFKRLKYGKRGYFVVVFIDDKRVSWRKWNRKNFLIKDAKKKFKKSNNLNPKIEKLTRKHVSRGDLIIEERKEPSKKKGFRNILVGVLILQAQKRGFRFPILTLGANSGFLDTFYDLESAKDEIRDKCKSIYMTKVNNVGSDTDILIISESYKYEARRYI